MNNVTQLFPPSPVIKTGSDFCRILWAQDGQQMLLCVGPGSKNNAVLHASASFVLNGKFCVFSSEMKMNAEEVVAWIAGKVPAMSEAQQAEYLQGQLAQSFAQAVKGTGV